MNRDDYVAMWKDLENIANKLANAVFYDKQIVGRKIHVCQKKIEAVIGQMSTGPNWHRKKP